MVKFETYKTRRKYVHKEEVFPIFTRVANRFICIGGAFAFLISSLVMSLASFFKIKNRVFEKVRRGKYYEVRIRRRI